MNGPLRSTATDATTTMLAVIAILRTSPYQNNGSEGMTCSVVIVRPRSSRGQAPADDPVIAGRGEGHRFGL
jgi:hypothetical protein